MPSTPTTRLRLEKQGSGENSNTWGDKLNEAVFDLLDESIAGVLSFSLSGAKTLTSANYDEDEARNAVINVTGGTGGTITIPSVQKSYLVRNAASDDVVITTGAGDTATVKAGNITGVFTDGTDTYLAGIFDYGAVVPKSSGTPSDADDLVNKAYADNLALSADLPGQPGNSGKFLYTNGSTASWAYPILTNATGILPDSAIPEFSGDVSNTATTLTIGANKVTLAQMAQIATSRILGRVSATTGNVETLTGTQVTALLDTFTETLKGLVPAPTDATGGFLRDDGTWATQGFPTQATAGRYILPDSLVRDGTTGRSADRLILVPFSTPGTYDAFAVHQAAVDMPGESVKYGIYSANADGSPGSLIISATGGFGFNQNSTQEVEIANTTISGPVWLAMLFNGGAASSGFVEGIAGGDAARIFGNDDFTLAQDGAYSHLRRAYTFGDLPASAGTGFTRWDGPIPLLALRVA